MKGQSYAVAILTSVITAAVGWLLINVLNSPAASASAYSSLDTRVTTLETKQVITAQNNLNRDNKTDFLVQAIYKISNKLNVDVGNPPINQ